MSGTKKYPAQTSLKYDPTRRTQAEEAYRHHIALVGRAGEPIRFNDVVDFALRLFIDMQGDVEASTCLFRATAMEEIARSHLLLQGQLQAIHETLFALRNPPPPDEPSRKQWMINTATQIEAQVSFGIRRAAMIQKAIFHDEKAIAKSLRNRREILQNAILITRQQMNEESILEAMRQAAEE
jgi:hypothetical protein